MNLPSAKIGKLIGKAGATIKDIQARGGARVKIDHEVRLLQMGSPLHGWSAAMWTSMFYA